MCTGMLLNFHTVTRRPWRFAVRSSTERRITRISERSSPRGPGAPRRVRLPVPHASPSYAGPEPPPTEASCAQTSVISTLE